MASPLAAPLGSTLASSIAAATWLGAPQDLGLAYFAGGVDSSGIRLKDSANTGTNRERQPGRARAFDGASQHITGPSFAAPLNFSAAAWVHCANLTGTQCLLSNRPSTSEWFIGRSGSALFLFGGSSAINKTAGTLVVNTWTHIGYSYDGTNARFYVNGALISTQAASGYTPSGSPQWTVGYDLSGAFRWNGRLSQVYFAPNQVLTDDQFAQLFNNQFVPITSANGFYYLMNVDATTLEYDASGNGNHGTVIGYTNGMDYAGTDVPYQPANERGWSCCSMTNLITQPNAFDNAYWSKRGTCTVVANDAYAPDGTLTADRIDGLNGPGNGNDIYVTAIPNAAGLVTRKLWIRRNTTTGVLRFQDAADGTGALDIDLAAIGAGWVQIDPSRVLPAGVTKVNANATRTASGAGFHLLATSGGPLSIWAWQAEVANGYRIPRNEANPSQEVLGNSLQFMGRCPIQPLLKNSNCLTLNGVNQTATIGTGIFDTDGTQPFTITARIKTAADGTIIGNMLDSGSFRGWEFSVSSGQLRLNLVNTAGTNQLQLNTAALVTDNQMHTVSVSYDGSRTPGGVTMSIDGINQKLTTVVNNLSATSAGGGGMSAIGARNGSSNFFNGSLCDLTVTIGANTWHYPLASGIGTTVYNDRANANHGTIQNFTSACWTTKQNVYHANYLNGYRLASGVYIPAQFGNAGLAADGNPLTNVPGGHNDCETEIDFRGDTSNDPYIRRAGGSVPTAHRRGLTLPGSFKSYLTATNESNFRVAATAP